MAEPLRLIDILSLDSHIGEQRSVNEVLDGSGTVAMLTDITNKSMKGHLGRPKENWPNIEKITKTFTLSS